MYPRLMVFNAFLIISELLMHCAARTPAATSYSFAPRYNTQHAMRLKRFLLRYYPPGMHSLTTQSARHVPL